MTNKEYILGKLCAFDINEAQLADMPIDLNGAYEPNSPDVGIAMCHLIEELVLAPRQKSINEQGFSVSWDYADVGKYYLWLCKKFGITPNEDVVSLMGISMITDKTDIW